jgi:hypothetical protein
LNVQFHAQEESEQQVYIEAESCLEYVTMVDLKMLPTL